MQQEEKKETFNFFQSVMDQMQEMHHLSEQREWNSVLDKDKPKKKKQKTPSESEGET